MDDKKSSKKNSTSLILAICSEASQQEIKKRQMELLQPPDLGEKLDLQFDDRDLSFLKKSLAFDSPDDGEWGLTLDWAERLEKLKELSGKNTSPFSLSAASTPLDDDYLASEESSAVALQNFEKDL